jgi:hypothetical protein
MSESFDLGLHATSDVVTSADLERLERDIRAQYGDILAGLLRQGLNLLERSEPGVALLIAHAGRELSNGVQRHLAVEEGLSRAVDAPESKREKREHRKILAAILQVQPEHDIVRRWSSAHDRLMRIVHYREQPPSHEDAVVGFLAIVRVVHALVGRFSTMKRELEALADIANPSTAEVNRAVHLLMRVQQRTVFYRRLTSPNWLARLVEQGVFASPPDRTSPGGSLWVGPWPEQAYLVRVAAAEPERVRDVFLAVSPQNTSPRVWGAAAEAARQMPADVVEPLVRRLAEVLPKVPPIFLTHEVMRLTVQLARTEPDAAVSLLSALLSLKRYEEVFPTDDGSPEARLFRGTSWMLRCVGQPDWVELVGRVVPAAAQTRPLDVMRLLAKKLRFALVQMRKLDGITQDDGISHFWCENIEWHHSALNTGDIRAVLATALWRLLSEHCMGSQERALEAFAMLMRYEDDIFLRLRAKFIAQCSHVAQNIVDEVLEHPAVLDAYGRAPEVRELLARRFGDASAVSKARFIRKITDGPSPDVILRLVAWERSWAARREGKSEYYEPDSLDDVAEDERLRAVHDWQARRVALFGGSPPPEAEALVASLLAQGGAVAGGEDLDQAPEEPIEIPAAVTPDDTMIAMSDGDIARLCAGSVSTTDDASSWEGVDLGAAVRAVVSSEPARLGSLLNALADAGAEPEYAHVVIQNILSHTERPEDIPWAEIVEAGGALLTAATTGLSDLENAESNPAPALIRVSEFNLWPRVVQSYLEALVRGVRNRLIPVEASFDVATLLDAIVDFWSANQLKASDIEHEPRRWRSVGETLAPLVVDAVASAAYWLNALQTGREPSDAPPAPELALGARLDQMLLSVGANHRSVVVAVGDVLPFLITAEREWVTRNSETLFATEHLELVLSGSLRRYYRDTFDVLRPELTRLASQLKQRTQRDAGAKARRVRLTERLAANVRDAWLDGRVTASDDDGLASDAFVLASKHAERLPYWGIYRGWRDAEGPIPDEMVERCLGLWRWRLSVLEQQPPRESRGREASELLWLLSTPSLPVRDILPLAIRTVKLRPQHKPPLSRLAEIIGADPVGAYDLFAELARSSLSTRSAYLERDEVAPAFLHVLASDDVNRIEAARNLLDQLARHVDVSFADLEMELGDVGDD